MPKETERPSPVSTGAQMALGFIGMFILLPAIPLLLLLNNAQQVAQMNRRKAPERAEKIQEWKAQRANVDNSQKSSEEVKAAQAEILRGWDVCQKDLREAFGYTDETFAQATQAHVEQACLQPD
ncbi:MAG: hypothetical protein AAGE59_34875 [Cyanobacteria bacterium P01_F01_bin.86]